MAYQHSLTPGTRARSEYEYAVEKDSELQIDPELASVEGKAGPLKITIYFAIMVFALLVVFYGMINQRDETVRPNAPAATQQQAPAQPPAAGEPQAAQPNPQQGTQGGPNPPANQPQQNPPAQPK